MAEGARDRLRQTTAAPAHADYGRPEVSSGAGGARRAVATNGASAPTLLPPNQIKRFYRGGERIDRLRRGDGRFAEGSEDWVGSTTSTLSSQTEGLSRLRDGSLLRDAIAADPVGYLGPEHVGRWGTDPALLVKLLDAGERLPVHFHPGRAFARDALNLRFGKTEAWIIVAADAGAMVHLGPRAPLDLATIADWVDGQDIASMLDAMNEQPVKPGDVVFVPAGTLHAIGEGILLVELQEPTDLSALLEWRRFEVSEQSATLGLGWSRVLEALDTTPPSPAPPPTARERASAAVTELLPRDADPYFSAQRIELHDGRTQLDQGFAILIVLDGRATLDTDGGELALSSGETVLVPHGAGAGSLQGDATLIRCAPPAPDAGEGDW